MKWLLMDFSCNTQSNVTQSNPPRTTPPPPTPHRACTHVSVYPCASMWLYATWDISDLPSIFSLSFSPPPSLAHTQVLLSGIPSPHTHKPTNTQAQKSHSGPFFPLFWRNFTICLDGGLPQTRPADCAGAEEHREPPPNPLHQGDDCSRQRVSGTSEHISQARSCRNLLREALQRQVVQGNRAILTSDFIYFLFFYTKLKPFIGACMLLCIHAVRHGSQ